MASGRYTIGQDECAAWTTSTYRFGLFKGSGYTFSKAHQYVADLTTASNECSLSGYSRQTAGTKTRVVNHTAGRIEYGCANPNFGSIVAGAAVTAMWMYRFVTNDADSILIAYYDLIDRTPDGNPFIVSMYLGLAAHLGDI